MITVMPASEARARELFSENAIQFTAFSGAVEAKCGGESLGFCLYLLGERSMTVLYLSAEDISLADGILRSALHVAVTHGITEAVYAPSAPEELFKKLGFIENGEKKELKINRLFESCRGCTDNAKK